MFAKLKEKLKNAVSLFSKKAVSEEDREKFVQEVVQKGQDPRKQLQTTKELSKKAAPDKEPQAQLGENQGAPSIGHLKKEPAQKARPEDKQKTEPRVGTVEEGLETAPDSAAGSDTEKENIPRSLERAEKGAIQQKVDITKRTAQIKNIQKSQVIKKSAEETPANAQTIIDKSTDTVPEKKGFFEKVKESITSKKISANTFEELFWDLEVALLENNVSVEVIERIKDDLKQELVDKPLPWNVEKKITERLQKTLYDILAQEELSILHEADKKKPLVIAFFGINGTGKTTSIAKLTYYLQQHGKSVVMAACDTFRAAAIQQLEEHALKLNVKMIKHEYGSDAAAVAFDAVKYAEKNNIDVVLIDTAGRLHSNTNLMAELEKIIRVVKPDLKIFVGESITGNDCIEQARRFNQLVSMDGAILTKADVDEKGGAPLSIAYTIKKPILFLGVGQKYEDLEEFNVEKILQNLGLDG